MPSDDEEYSKGFDPSKYGSSLQGIDRQVFITKRLSDAMSQPGKYFRDRTAQLKLIQGSAQVVFKNKYEAYRKIGLPADQAKLKATNYTNAVISTEFDEFNDEWPADISDLSVDKLLKKASASIKTMPNIN